jgi:hypothetical protein
LYDNLPHALLSQVYHAIAADEIRILSPDASRATPDDSAQRVSGTSDTLEQRQQAHAAATTRAISAAMQALRESEKKRQESGGGRGRDDSFGFSGSGSGGGGMWDVGLSAVQCKEMLLSISGPLVERERERASSSAYLRACKTSMLRINPLCY